MADCLDLYAGRYERLPDVSTFGEYVSAKGDRADEEILTEPVLASILERVLDFPVGGYFPQLSKSGLKPDFTPKDLIAHPFVLDAKSSDQQLGPHEPQIRRYIGQRALDYGILFNLREIRVYRRGEKGHLASLSFSLLPLWQVARGEALPTTELDAFEQFCERFSYREMGPAEKVDWIRRQQPWSIRLAAEPVEVDVEFLVQRLHDLSVELAGDAAAQVGRLDAFVRLNPARERKMLGELRQLALDIEPGTDLDRLPGTLLEWRTGEGLAARVWRQYLLRVAYLALARILLYRAWEDVEFVDQFLYDGGFDIAYARLSEKAREVLDEAFLHGAERYRWLFGAENNYEWYRPREAALVNVLYSLAPVPLGKLDADVLGALYVSYVDEIDRDRLGQFFTPRPVVRFMLDRAGFRGPEGVFRVEGDERKPLRVLDFATGSGGFLVEAARRIIDDAAVKNDDPRELEEALAAIVRGFIGGEISPFPYYLTEINLLLQISRLLGRLSIAGGEKPPAFVLGALHMDTLTARSAHDASLDEFDPKLRADRAELVGDEAYDLIPLDGEKLETFRRLREDESFDLVVGNPPYVTEANNKPLFDRLRAIAAWKGVYRGKADYAYYFLYLAAEKLAPGGRLCVITPAGWMNAGAADFLREKLAGELRLDELFLFGSYRLFADEQGPAPTPTVESAILVATKAPAQQAHNLRVVALEDEEPAPSDREGLLAEMARRAAGKPGRKDGIHVHDVPQAELRPEWPWPVKHGAKDVAARVVTHLQRLLEDEAAPVESLAASWKVFMGIETGADAYTRRVRNRLPAEIRADLESKGARIGDPILQLPAGRESKPPWPTQTEFLAKAPEARAILYGAVDESDYTSYVRIDRGQAVPPEVLEQLDFWRPVLMRRAEIERNPKRKWWETAWPRDTADLRSPKVIGVHRTNRGRFAVDEEGGWRAGKAVAVVVGADEVAPVAYLCGLLNSELIDLWYSLRGRTPRDVWRDYEPKPMNQIPYRRPDGNAQAEQIADLVRRVAANRRALLLHRAVVRDLGRTVKDPWRTWPVEIDRTALIREVAAKGTVSLRLDPQLEATIRSTPLGTPHRDAPDSLVFRRAREETGRVAGDPGRLDLLEEIVGHRAPDDLLALTLPRDLVLFERQVAARKTLVENLLAEGRALVEEVERLVCSLYEVPDELTEEVVAHAATRAASGQSAKDE